MPTHLGFDAWISSDGEVLKEHQVTKSNNRVDCYIPSEHGKTFSVLWRDLASGVWSCAYIWLDGYVVPGRYLQGDGKIASRQGVRTGPQSEKPFTFSEVQSTNPTKPHNPDGGTIKLEIKLIQRRSTSVPNNEIQRLPESNHDRLSQGAHRIGYGNESATWEQCPTTWDFDPVQTYVTFCFHYRSPEWFMTNPAVAANVTQTSKTCKQKMKPSPTRRKSGAHTSTPASAERPKILSHTSDHWFSIAAQTRAQAAPALSAPGPSEDAREAHLVQPTLVTPSPTPSPKTKKINRLSSGMRKAFYPGMSNGIGRQKSNVRTVSSRANNDSWQGLMSFEDVESGETTLFATPAIEPIPLPLKQEDRLAASAELHRSHYASNVEYYGPGGH